jgi:hypothetical protein
LPRRTEEKHETDQDRYPPGFEPGISQIQDYIVSVRPTFSTNRSSEADGRLGSHVIPSLLRNVKVHNRIHNSCPLAFSHCLPLRRVSMASSHLRPGLPYCPFIYGFLSKISYVMLHRIGTSSVTATRGLRQVVQSVPEPSHLPSSVHQETCL